MNLLTLSGVNKICDLSAIVVFNKKVENCFVMRKFFRMGFGKEAAVKLFGLFPRKWSITQVEKNEPAKTFWRKLFVSTQVETTVKDSMNAIDLFRNLILH